jgi:hypothetical protein
VTQGVLKSQKFNVKNGDFSASFVADTSIDQPSVVFWSQEFWYPQGLSMKLFDAAGKQSTLGADFTLDQSVANFSKFKITNPALNGQVVTVNMVAKYISGDNVTVLE